MIRKKSLLPFTLLSLILSGTVSLCAQAAPDTQDFARRKTAGERIVSGLGHTALLVPSIPMLALSAVGLSQLPDPHDLLITATILIVSAYSASSAIKNISSAIKNNPEEPTTPVTKIDLAKKAILGTSGIVLLHIIASNRTNDWLDFAGSIPGMYALVSTLKTFYRATQEHKKSSNSQEPKIQTITE